MQILTLIQKNSYIICLEGCLNSLNEIKAQQALHEAAANKPKEILIDCEALREVSMTSIRPFIATIREIQSLQIRFVLISVNKQLNDILFHSGLRFYTKPVAFTSILEPKEQYDIILQQL